MVPLFFSDFSVGCGPDGYLIIFFRSIRDPAAPLTQVVYIIYEFRALFHRA